MNWQAGHYLSGGCFFSSNGRKERKERKDLPFLSMPLAVWCKKSHIGHLITHSCLLGVHMFMICCICHTSRGEGGGGCKGGSKLILWIYLTFLTKQQENKKRNNTPSSFAIKNHSYVPLSTLSFLILSPSLPYLPFTNSFSTCHKTGHWLSSNAMAKWFSNNYHYCRNHMFFTVQMDGVWIR